MGKFGRGISDSKFEDIKNQIDQGIPTYAYLFENSPFDGAFVAEIKDIANDYFDTKSDLILLLQKGSQGLRYLF